MATQRRLEGRNGAIARGYFVAGKTQSELAEEFGLDRTRVSQIIAEARAEIPEVDKVEYLQKSLETLQYVQQVAAELIEHEGAPVTAGKDGDVVYDPESGVVVRDYSGRVLAAQLLLKASEAQAKRLGLDAATKIESTATVRYEIAGLNDDDLS
jgi:transcriptional regulator with XRE-family HTH domain